MVNQEGVNFDQVVLDVNGKPLVEKYFEEENQVRGERLQDKARLVGRLSIEEAEELLNLKQDRPIKLGNCCCQALWASTKDDTADGAQKIRRAKLALKIQASSDEDEPYPTLVLSSKQKKMILDQGEKMWGTLVYARIYEALEGTLSEEDD